MKRTPLKNKKRLARKTPLRSRSKTKAYRRRPRDLAYLRAVKTLPCVVREVERLLPFVPGTCPSPTLCEGPVQADHMGRRGLGQKSHDHETASICRKHHGERTDLRGTFAGCNRVMMRSFCEQAIALTRKRLEERAAHA